MKTFLFKSHIHYTIIFLITIPMYVRVDRFEQLLSFLLSSSWHSIHFLLLKSEWIEWNAMKCERRNPLRSILSCPVISCDVLSCHVMSPVVAWHGTALHNTAWHYTASYGSNSLSFSFSISSRLKHTHTDTDTHRPYIIYYTLTPAYIDTW